MHKLAEELYSDARGMLSDIHLLQCTDPTDENTVAEYANTLKFKTAAAEILVVAARDICADDYRMKSLDRESSFIIPSVKLVGGEEAK